MARRDPPGADDDAPVRGILSLVSAMVAELPPDHALAAMKIAALQSSSRHPVPEHSVRRLFTWRRDRMDRVLDAISPHFNLVEGCWSHPLVAADLRARAEADAARSKTLAQRRKAPGARSKEEAAAPVPAPVPAAPPPPAKAQAPVRPPASAPPPASADRPAAAAPKPPTPARTKAPETVPEASAVPTPVSAPAAEDLAPPPPPPQAQVRAGQDKPPKAAKAPQAAPESLVECGWEPPPRAKGVPILPKAPPPPAPSLLYEEVLRGSGQPTSPRKPKPLQGSLGLEIKGKVLDFDSVDAFKSIPLAASRAPTDQEIAFSAVAILVADGYKDKDARSVIGRKVKDHGAAVVAAAVRRCLERFSDPSSEEVVSKATWLFKVIESVAKKGTTRAPSGSSRKARASAPGVSVSDLGLTPALTKAPSAPSSVSTPARGGRPPMPPMPTFGKTPSPAKTPK